MRSLVLCALAVVLTLSPAPADESKKADLKLTDDEKAVLAETNKQRKAAGLPELKPSPILMKMAREHSKTMARLNQLGHDLDGQTFQGRINESKYGFRRAGENVATGYATPKAAVEGWMNSPQHKDNMLSMEFTEIGVAVEKSADGTRYWTQVFGSPLNK